MKNFIAVMNAKYPEQAKHIPEIPEMLTQAYLKENIAAPAPYTFIIGMDYNTVEAVTINMLKTGYFAISDREQSGKTNFVRYLFVCMSKYDPIRFSVEAFIVDDYERRLETLCQYDFVKHYSTELGDLEIRLRVLEEECAKRRKLIKADGAKALDNLPLQLVVIQNNTFFESGAFSKDGLQLCAKPLEMGKDVKRFIAFTNVENILILYSGSDVQKIMKETKNVFFF